MKCQRPRYEQHSKKQPREETTATGINSRTNYSYSNIIKIFVCNCTTEGKHEQDSFPALSYLDEPAGYSNSHEVLTPARYSFILFFSFSFHLLDSGY